MIDQPLSPETKRRLMVVFSAPAQAQAEALLVTECGQKIPFYEDATSEELERVRFAVLKLSKGTISGLIRAIDLAQTDWRDLLIAAGFADDVHAHARWLAES